jgi:hypothetical protein
VDEPARLAFAELVRSVVSRGVRLTGMPELLQRTNAPAVAEALMWVPHP